MPLQHSDQECVANHQFALVAAEWVVGEATLGELELSHAEWLAETEK